jgi:hypothetical protein
MAPTERAKRFRKGAGKGYPLEQLEFGLLHYRGTEGVNRNLPTAAEWIKKAATQGLARAQSWLGDLYVEGEGVERDMEQAMVWWRKAASQDPDSYEEKSQRKSIMLARRNLAKAYDAGGEGARTSALIKSTLSGWFQPSSHFMSSCLQYLTCAQLKSLRFNCPQLNDTSVAYVSKADIISAGGCLQGLLQGFEALDELQLKCLLTFTISLAGRHGAGSKALLSPANSAFTLPKNEQWHCLHPHLCRQKFAHEQHFTHSKHDLRFSAYNVSGSVMTTNARCAVK